MFYIVEFADCGSPALVQIHSSCVFKGRLQSLLRMSVIVFAWGLHRKLGISVYTRSSLISGNNTRVVFFASEGVKLEVSKIY